MEGLELPRLLLIAIVLALGSLVEKLLAGGLLELLVNAVELVAIEVDNIVMGDIFYIVELYVIMMIDVVSNWWTKALSVLGEH